MLRTQINKYVVLIHFVFLGISMCWGWEEGWDRCGTCYWNSLPGCGTCPVLNEEHVFGDENFSTVYTGSSCSSISFALACGSECVPGFGEWGGLTCEYKQSSLPGFLGSTASINWGEQGANVVVACDSVFPAVGKVEYSGPLSDGQIEHYSRDCPGCPARTYMLASRIDSHYFMASFDPNVFVVNGSRTSPCEFRSGITVTLLNTNCETLKKAKDSKIKLFHQKHQDVYMHNDSCSEDEFISPRKAELTSATSTGSVGVKFIGQSFSCQCPNADTPNACPFDGGKGCSSGSCGENGDKSGLAIGNASANITFDLSETLSVYGSPDISMGYGSGSYGTPEINAANTWLRAAHYPYQATNIVYSPTVSPDGDRITKIAYSYQVIVSGTKTYHYSFQLVGSWEDQASAPYKSKEQVALEAFLNTARGKVRLTHVTTIPGGTTILSFQYDSEGNIEKQISYDETGFPNGYIKYDYENGTLARIWAGVDENYYAAFGSQPAGGRWIDVTYAEGSNGRAYLSSITYGGCSLCKSPRLVERGGPDDNLPTIIKKVDGTVLAAYSYDLNGRHKSYSLGNNALKVNEWEHSDYDPANPGLTAVDNMTLRRDYVNNKEYRAKVYFADNSGALTKEIHYHQLQDDPNRLQGPYSVYRYYHQLHDEDGTVNDWKRYVTVYPKGNKLYKYYDYNNGEYNGDVIKIQWDQAGGPDMEYQYTTQYYGDDTQRMVQKETNPYGGETVYSYSGFNLLSRTEAIPGLGVTGATQVRQVTTYEYDSQSRVRYEWKKYSTDTNVCTGFVYDSIGNRKRIHENCTYNQGADPTGGLVTYYDYNDYNELIKTTYPSGRIERRFYSGSGSLIAEAVYADDTYASAVSATVYIYNDGKLEIKKTAKEDGPFTFNDAVVAAGGAGINWVCEAYEYDVYGRRTVVISDAQGLALRTEYQYNNQNEVVLVVKPDQRYVRTVRDGRGLVAEEVTGVRITNGQEVIYFDKATTRHTYDLNGNLIKKVDPEGVTEVYQYDQRDRLVCSRRGK